MGYLVLIGTRKGLFTATSDNRTDWEVKGPVILDKDGFTAVAEIYSVAADAATGRILIGADTFFGPSIWRSGDYARTWSEPEKAPMAFPQDLPYRPLDFSEAAGIDQPESDQNNTVKRIWQLAFGPGERVWAGVEPTSLWVSDDGGQTFAFNQPLWDHPEHTTWASGAGGPAVHTIVPDPADPEALTIAISSGGIYQTDDDGQSWTGITKGITADYSPEDAPESGQCIHKVTRGTDSTLFVQSHGPAYRSTRPDGGWTNISGDLPTNFGFAMIAHPTLDGNVIAWPCTESMERTPPGRQVGPWRTTDSGETWNAWTDGLPTDPYFGGVLRDGACTDAAADPGWYFGTRCGDIWTATDSGGTWNSIAAHLPDVLCVRAIETP
ncbi:exo-alpha-sialidase [Glycomyces buryatensis]|uniref:Exo-alpha-sialidase n=1 Tax=Glycomyces buryatensis TaxID=2570927 RepID=A0A4S8Q039_9ACTN|nr:exo-alpha-sialidase [Glycomyces buryatensis]THV33434.1 exo-alpha-sialidase [Glycomyces buryatensis]